MPLSLYDTARREIVPFEPLNPGRVGIYHCGPTVYSTAHVGNFRSFLLGDLLRRHLERSGYAVHQVMNITDVGHLTVDDQADAAGEDKLQRAARSLGWDPWRVARHFEASFHEDRRKLRIVDAHAYPRATEHVPDMLAMIQTLLDRDYAYIVDGEAYFDVSRFPEYGALSGRSVEDQRAGARVATHANKRRPEDFALWKVDEAHLMQFDPFDDALWAGWPAPRPALDPRLGRGFPGWHIECSAMSRRTLGKTFDIHTGGEDNLFPHHECEVAQSTAANDAPLANYWLHTRHLLVNGSKLSKRSGAAITVRELADRGFEPRVVRYLLLSHHYRRPMNLTVSGLVAAREAVARLRALRDALRHKARAGTPSSTMQDQSDALVDAFNGALDRDLDTPRALEVVFSGIRDWENRSLEPADAAAALLALELVDGVFDVFDERVRSGAVPFDKMPDAVDLDAVLGSLTANDPATVEAVLAARHHARAARDWSAADRLRKALSSVGIAVRDGADRVQWCISDDERPHATNGHKGR